jgi:hypothetical protein
MQGASNPVNHMSRTMPQRILRVLESLGQLSAQRLVANVLLPLGRVGGGARLHDLDRAPL